MTAKKLTPKDFDAGIDVRWCPGCGDYSILANVRKILPQLGLPREKFVFISGIGCSSRFPYYMNTFGFHTIHGRAPAIATGLKIQRPDLNVWVVTGDGDALSIGGNHFIHAARRNIDLNLMLFNNRIYGLTKGQYSPTSEVGKVTKSTPLGSIDHPFRPVSVLLGAEASFVARAVDTDAQSLRDVLKQANAHRGFSAVEILQNCPIFNDGAFVQLTDKAQKQDTLLHLRAGEPMIFGKDNDRGLIFNNGKLVVVQLGNGVSAADLLVHNPTDQNPSVAFALASLDSPTPVGVLRSVERPSYDDSLNAQVAQAKEQRGKCSLKELVHGSETWVVE